MGTKITSIVAPTQHGDELGKQVAIEEKYAWQEVRGSQFNPTASILRYTVTGEDAAAGIDGTSTLVSGLSNLSVTVDDYTVEFTRMFGGENAAGSKKFVFYDVEVVHTDVIQYGDHTYEPTQVDYDEESGRCEVVAQLQGSS